MADPRRVQRAGAAVLSAAMLLLGVAMLVVTLTRGGGPLAVGVLLGVLFCLAGAGRLWLTREDR